MKISKATRWILTIGILVILIGSLGVNYARQKSEQSKLNANIAQAQQDFIKYTREHPAQDYIAQKEDLEARINQANSRIAGAQSELRQYTESIEINKTLFEAAKEANVTIITLTSSPPEENELNGINYQAFTLNINAEGEVVALLTFLDKVSHRFDTSHINSVEIDVPAEDEQKSKIAFGLKVYAYESDE